MARISILPTEIALDPSQDIFHFLKHQEVLKSDHSYPGLLQVGGPLGIFYFCMIIPMNLTVKLNCQPFVNAVEIKDEWPNAVLTPELSSVEF